MRGVHLQRYAPGAKRTASRIVRLLTPIAPRSRDKWFKFIEGVKAGDDPIDIARSAGVSLYTVYHWMKALA
jgi:hypothetical protein